MVTSQSTTAPANADQSAIPVFRRYAILASAVMATTLYSMSILVASTVLPQMQGAMAATADEIAWTMTFNILATAAVTPMTGWLVARFGRRNVMFWGVTIFGVATYACGAAASLEMLIFARVIQGGAGAPVLPLAQAIVLDVFPKRQHGFVLGLYGMGVVCGPVAGPMLGGVLAEWYGWRWAFYMMVPIAAVAAVSLRLVLRQRPSRPSVKLDWTGFLSLTVAMGCLQLILARGLRLDWFDSFEIQVEAFLGALAFYVFIAHSLTTRSKPFLTLSLLMNRNFTLGLLLITLYGMVNFTPMVLLPPLLQQHAGFPDGLIGQVLAFRGIGAVMGFFIVMFARDVDPRISISIGFLLQAISGIWLMSVNLDVDVWVLSVNACIQGLAVGAIFAPLTTVTFSTMEKEHLPEAVSVYHFLRNIGSSLFISICVAEIVRSTGANYGRLREFVSPFNETIQMPWVMGGWVMNDVGGLARLSKEINRQAAMIGYINAFALYTLVSIVALPLVLLVKRGRP